MFVSPGEVAFYVNSVPIYYYGIIMAISISVGVITAYFIAVRFYPQINSDVIYDISPHIIIGAILGARIYYCILNYGYYSKHLVETLQIWRGGISIHGAIIGGLITGIIYAKRHKLPVLKLCDIFSYGLILGQATGRWGNFFNSEAFGRPTENFLKLYIPIYKRPLEYMQYNYFHPTFLYESVLDICIFLILFFIVRKFATKPSHNVALNLLTKGTAKEASEECDPVCVAQGRMSEQPCDAETSSARREYYDGIVFFSYLILYSIVRIIIEQIRVDSILNVYGIPIAQIVSCLIILISVLSIFIIRLKNEST